MPAIGWYWLYDDNVLRITCKERQAKGGVKCDLHNMYSIAIVKVLFMMIVISVKVFSAAYERVFMLQSLFREDMLTCLDM